MTRYLSVFIAHALLLFGSGGCLDAAGPSPGQIHLDLAGRAPSGVVYRLRQGVITVVGPTSTTFDTEEDPDRTVLSEDVEPGNYQVSLDPGWRLERIVGATATTVAAELVSDNPASFTVREGERTVVPLRFQVDTDVVTMGSGFDLVIEPETRPSLLVVATTSKISVYSPSASGTAPPLRTITPLPQFPGGVISLSGLAVVNRTILVGQGSSEIDSIGVDSSGPVTVFSRLRSVSPFLRDPISVVVRDDEIYVSQQNGLVSVFSRFAAGETRPLRALSVVTGSCMDVSRGEIYLRDFSGGIAVYSAASDGGAPPLRVISSDAIGPGAASCLFVAGGEVFVTVPEQNAIMVFPKTASGSLAPIRVIAGDQTTLDLPRQLTVYRGELFVASQSNRIAVFPADATGNVAPTRTLQVNETFSSSIRGMVVY